MAFQHSDIQSYSTNYISLIWLPLPTLSLNDTSDEWILCTPMYLWVTKWQGMVSRPLTILMKPTSMSRIQKHSPDSTSLIFTVSSNGSEQEQEACIRADCNEEDLNWWRVSIHAGERSGCYGSVCGGCECPKVCSKKAWFLTIIYEFLVLTSNRGWLCNRGRHVRWFWGRCQRHFLGIFVFMPRLDIFMNIFKDEENQQESKDYVIRGSAVWSMETKIA